MYTTSPLTHSMITPALAISIPLYIQIAEGLISQVESGELAPGDRLPAERELSEKLGVNRMTLRRALHVLEAHGVITRKHGIGTYIAEPKIDRRMDTVFRFTTGMQSRGYTPGTRLISLEDSFLDAALAQQLALPVAAPAYHIRHPSAKATTLAFCRPHVSLRVVSPASHFCCHVSLRATNLAFA